MTLRVGVVGAGSMGADHATTVDRYVSGAEVTYVADLDLARAEAAAGQLRNAVAGEDPLALVDDERVDAVVVASADSTHADLVLACLAVGKPVLCEKPLAPTAAECRDLVETEQALGLGVPLVTVGFMRRFDPGYVAMQERLRSGALGGAVMLHCVSRGISAGPGTTSEQSIVGSAIHELDVVPWLVGSPLTAVSWHAPPAAPDHLPLRDPQLLLLQTESGVLATVEVFLNAGYGYDVRCELVGSRGTVALAEPVRTVVDAALARGTSYAADWRPRFADAYRLQLQAWVDAVAAGVRAPLADAIDGWRAAVAAEAAIRAMHAGDGRPVAVGEA